MKKLDLIVGETYELHHRRKGIFRARLDGVVPADPGDEKDGQLLTLSIDTRRGSGQERLARSPSATTVTNIRPSLVTQIKRLEGQPWRITMLGEPPPRKPATLMDRIKARFNFGK